MPVHLETFYNKLGVPVKAYPRRGKLFRFPSSIMLLTLGLAPQFLWSPAPRLYFI
jgi:hypothetical protein